MEIDNLRVQLNNCVEILENTLNDLNLQIINYGISHISDDGGYNVILEIVSVSNASISQNVVIKVNVYEENNSIIATEHQTIFKEDFSGYDTLEVWLQIDNLAYNTSKIRIFAVKR